ncbi:MAG TPA: hypothetical protein VGT05_03080 [Patescibacteria group bacterium]|nr:hypothetical protein [Patescibacteria group bacterium]
MRHSSDTKQKWKNTIERPFGSLLLALCSISLGIFEGYLTLPLFFPWKSDTTMTWYAFLVIILFSIAAIAQVFLGGMLIFFFFINISKRLYQHMFVLDSVLITCGITLGFLLIVITFSQLSHLY